MTKTETEGVEGPEIVITVNLSFEEAYVEDIEGEQTVTFMVTEDL